MEVKNIDNYSVYSGSLVKYTRMGNITQILSLSHKNSKCPIKKISKEEYMYLDTGEILQCNHIENRSQNINTIRYSISNLRNLINNNFVGGQNEFEIPLENIIRVSMGTQGLGRTIIIHTLEKSYTLNFMNCTDLFWNAFTGVLKIPS